MSRSLALTRSVPSRRQSPVCERVGQRAEERGPLLDVEVADGAAEEGHDLAPASGQMAQVQREVAHDGLDLQAGITLGELGSGGAQRPLGHVDRHEADQRPVRCEGVEQGAGLVAGATAELDHGVSARQLDDLVGMGHQQGSLGLGGVVLRQSRDLVEQLGSAIVVEPGGWQGARMGGQAAAHVVDQAAGGPSGVQHHRDDRLQDAAHEGAPPSARRTPDIAHRAPGGKKLR